MKLILIFAIYIFFPMASYATDTQDVVASIYSEQIHRDQTEIKDTDPTEQMANISGLILRRLKERYIKENGIEVSDTDIRVFLEATDRLHMADRERKAKQRKKFTAKLSDTNLTEKERSRFTKRLETIERLLANDTKREDELKSLSDTEQAAVEASKIQVTTEMIETWKFYGHLYKKYGGGRILFQQFGIEPFDAFKKWLGEQERRRIFVIHDAEAKKTFWQYWTRDHGPFMTEESKIEEAYGSKNPFETPWWLTKGKESDDE